MANDLSELLAEIEARVKQAESYDGQNRLIAFGILGGDVARLLAALRLCIARLEEIKEIEELFEAKEERVLLSDVKETLAALAAVLRGEHG